MNLLISTFTYIGEIRMLEIHDNSLTIKKIIVMKVFSDEI